MKKLSLRVRLILFFALISAVVWGIAALLSWKETKESIDEFFDTYQLTLGRSLAAADWRHITPETQKITNKIIGSIHNADEDDDAVGFAVFNLRGQMVFHDNEKGKHFAYSPATGSFGKEKCDGEAWRIVRLPSADNNYIIAVGQELEYRDDIVWDMVEEFMLPWLVGLFLLLASTIVMISVEFWPLKNLADKIGKRSPEDLSPLETEKLPAEVLPLIAAMNRLLRQVEAMLERERSFIADSAHELRSPLTALKVQLEIVQMSEDDPQTRAAALQKLEQGIERSARLVEQLLAFSRLESSLSESEESGGVIEWQSLVDTVVDEYRAEAGQKRIAVTSDIAPDAPVAGGNAVLWTLLLRNLLDNAVKYSPDGATVSIVIRNNKLEVVNSGIRVDENVLSRLHERFFRPAGQKQTGSGLGLAIVEKISRFHNCRMQLENTDEGFKVSIIPL